MHPAVIEALGCRQYAIMYFSLSFSNANDAMHTVSVAPQQYNSTLICILSTIQSEALIYPWGCCTAAGRTSQARQAIARRISFCLHTRSMSHEIAHLALLVANVSLEVL